MACIVCMGSWPMPVPAVSYTGHGGPSWRCGFGRVRVEAGGELRSEWGRDDPLRMRGTHSLVPPFTCSQSKKVGLPCRVRLFNTPKHTDAWFGFGEKSNCTLSGRRICLCDITLCITQSMSQKYAFNSDAYFLLPKKDKKVSARNGMREPPGGYKTVLGTSWSQEESGATSLSVRLPPEGQSLFYQPRRRIPASDGPKSLRTDLSPIWALIYMCGSMG